MKAKCLFGELLNFKLIFRNIKESGSHLNLHLKRKKMMANKLDEKLNKIEKCCRIYDFVIVKRKKRRIAKTIEF